jgi:hypothetical protein
MAYELLNTGNLNTGNLNTGDLNTGNLNTGDLNTGTRNTGDWNTGDWNTGDRNTGNRNTGNRNTGDWNTGTRNMGYFCTLTPSPMFFDLPTSLTWGEAENAVPYVDLCVGAEFIESSKMTSEQKAQNPAHTTIGGFLRAISLTIQQAFPIAWAKMRDDERAKWLALPNFNAEKFLACTGVDVRKPATKTVKIRLAGGEVVSGEIVE